MYNGSYWNFKKSRYNVIGDEIRPLRGCYDECEEVWEPEETEDEEETE